MVPVNVEDDDFHEPFGIHEQTKGGALSEGKVKEAGEENGANHLADGDKEDGDGMNILCKE